MGLRNPLEKRHLRIVFDSVCRSSQTLSTMFSRSG